MLDYEQINATLLSCGVDLEGLFSELSDQPRLGLAVSGGPDSIALALMVRAWLDRREQEVIPNIVIYSVDHGLRAEAAGEVELVSLFAQKLGFAFRGLKWAGDKPVNGVQAAARQARYALIGAQMAKDEVPLLLTAHHLNDQAETVLMRLAHGSGLTGLQGMVRYSNLFGTHIMRPLLEVPGAVLKQIATQSGVAFVEDPSNENAQFERVRWRQIAPTLDQFGLNADRLSLFSRRVARAERALERQKAALIAQHDPLDEFGVAHFVRAEFDTWDEEMRVRVLRHFLHLCGGSGNEPELEKVERLCAQLERPAFDSTTLGGCAIVRDKQRILMFREVGRMDDRQVIVQPGQQVHWDQRFLVVNHAGEPLTLRSAKELVRADIERMLNRQVDLPMDAIAGTLRITDVSGEIVALGLMVLRGAILVQPAAKLPPFLQKMI